MCGVPVYQQKREVMTVVFGCQRFSTHLMGKSFIAESDHKPLEIIAINNLASAAPCLHKMPLQLQQFDITIHYMPGPEMQLLDALIRFPGRASLQMKLSMCVDYVAF